MALGVVSHLNCINVIISKVHRRTQQSGRYRVSSFNLGPVTYTFSANHLTSALAVKLSRAQITYVSSCPLSMHNLRLAESMPFVQGP